MLVGEDIQGRVVVVDGGAQSWLEKVPVTGAVEWKPIGSALQDRLGPLLLGRGDVIGGAKFDCGQVVGVTRGGEATDARLPLRGRHRDAQVIECRAAADECFTAGMVCGPYDSVAIDEQVDGVDVGIALYDPPPRLTVVHRRCSAGQQDCVREHLDVHDVDATGHWLWLARVIRHFGKCRVSSWFHGSWWAVC
ncbi:hypothetical protein NIIDMKKI_55490 [Mycobacterium kansasii]|uniref:Uncharacterized protein n=1 Tax=Mycobacterium kansasii TaxID=1768 RepID=A0A7G1IK51_MYCKA|nr:hypothetical protein NIIDMKKI_55490 [Mycobacterium kansasii]